MEHKTGKEADIVVKRRKIPLKCIVVVNIFIAVFVSVFAIKYFV